MAKKLVVDASLATRWFLTYREDADVAEDILLAILGDEIEAHAPRVFTYEVSHALTKACSTRDPVTKEPRLSPDDADQHVHALFELPITITPATEEEASEALRMGTTFGKKHADMTYLRLAVELDAEWCTADAKVLKGGVPPEFPAQRVLLLASVQEGWSSPGYPG